MEEPRQTEDGHPGIKGKDVKAPNIIERAKEEIEAVIHSGKKTHHKETHGTSGDIDENTPVDAVKAPNVFERAKEEVEALVEAIHPPKQEPKHDSPSKQSGGCFGSLGRRLEHFCQPHRKES
ncbi:uncharacterized protein LOC116246964 [Nymphaea colorata]|nr:uncharacterized protein LOC116246964 [Nymphaea colorata]